jgi:hypothetical protein
MTQINRREARKKEFRIVTGTTLFTRVRGVNNGGQRTVCQTYESGGRRNGARSSESAS